MTLDKLLEQAECLPVEELEKLTDVEIEAYFAPFINVVRPVVPVVRAVTPIKDKANKPSSLKDKLTPEQLQRAKFIQEQYGLKLKGL